DAFCAALTIALRAGIPAEAALRTANAVGAYAVTDPSARPAFPTLDHFLSETGPAHDPLPIGPGKDKDRR
ncbi:hypothetical protein K4H02_25215, partial [Mycobacterium tuberculosis]|nr:hypothetical protein [Mycobacterium tuberculosis]